MNCTRCQGVGVLNYEQVPEAEWQAIENSDDREGDILKWIEEHDDHDVMVCDCCGDGEGWHGMPGEHDESQFGRDGPYAYNGGLPECW